MLEIVHVGTAKFTVVTESNYSKQQWMKHFKEATSSWVDMKAKLMARAEGSEASSPATGAGIPVLSLDHSATTAAEDQFDNSNMINPMMMLERKQSVMSQLAASASTTSTSSNTNLASENAQTKQDSLQLKENGAIVVGSANSNNAVSAIIMDFANREQHARAQSTPAHQANHAPRRPPPKVPPKISERRTFAASPDNTNNVSSTHHAVINNGSSSVLNTIKELATKADSTKPVKTSNGSLEAVNLISLDGSRKIANNAFIVQDVVSAGSSPVNSTENLNKPSPNGSRARSATVDPGLQKRSGFTPIGAPNSQGITPPTPPSVPPPPIPKSPAALATSPSSASIKAPFPPPVPVKPTNKGLAGSRPSSAASTTASANASVDVTDAPTPPSSSGNTPSSSSSKPVADAASIGSIVAADVVNGMTTRSTATATGTLRIKKLQSPPLPQKMRVAESWTTAAVVKAEETVSSNVETFNGSSVSSITAKIESNNNNNSSSSRVSVAGSSARNSNVGKSHDYVNRYYPSDFKHFTSPTAPRDVSGSIGIVKSGKSVMRVPVVCKKAGRIVTPSCSFFSP